MLSICIFGSQARKSTDALSDRDVLIVGPPSLTLDRAVADWSTREWNVSVFNRPAIKRLADVKALFVQHLKLEGLLVRDEGDFLGSLLDRYSPKDDYAPERNDALRQIVALPPASNAYWRDMCLADIVYVLFRNAAILHLACEKEYCFQYDLLVDRMAYLFSLDCDQKNLLLSLRDLKHGYRRRAEALTAGPSLREVRIIIGKILEHLSNDSVSSVAAGVTTDDYFTLRLTELELVTRNDPRQLDELSPASESFAIWQRIRSSAEYPKTKISIQ